MCFASQCEGNRAMCTTGLWEVSFPLVFHQGWLERNGDCSCGRFKLWARKLVSESFIHAVLHIFQSKLHCNTVVWGTKVCVLAWTGHGRSVAGPCLSAPTILCTGSQQINDVLVLPNDLHHLHLWNQVWQVFLCGISWRKREINHIRVISWRSVGEKAQKGLTIITLQRIYTNTAAPAALGSSLSWRMLPGERHLKHETINATFPTSSLLCTV